MRFFRKKTSTWLAIGAIATVAMVGIAPAGASLTSKHVTAHTAKLTNLNLILDFYFSPSHAALAYGIAHGIFKANGINLSLTPGTGSGLALQEINQGKFDFALSDLDTYAVQRLQHQTTAQAIYSFTPKPTFGLLTTFPVNKLSDFSGHAFVTVPGSEGITVLPYVLKQNGVNPATVPIKTVSFSVLYSELFHGAISVAEWHLPGDEGALQEAATLHKKVYTTTFTKYGLNTPARVVLAKASLLASNPAIVKKFLKALNESIAAAYKAPISQIVAALKPYDPQEVPSEVALEWGDVTKIMTNYGAITTAQAADALKLVEATDKLKASLPPSSLFTDKYLP